MPAFLMPVNGNGILLNKNENSVFFIHFVEYCS